MSNKPKPKPGKGILLENVPIDVQEALISKKNELSDDCKCERGQNYALYSIVREWQQSVGDSENVPVVIFGGQIQKLDDNVSVEFVGTHVHISFKVPITSPVGAIFNYERQKK